LFRANIKNETELGKQVKSILASGGLVPDSVTIAMVKSRLSDKDAKTGYILDGFPRTVPQADALKAMSDVDAVINFVVPDETIIRRLSGRRVCKSTGKTYHIIYNPPKTEGIDDETGEPLIQREDDKPQAIAHRLEVYAQSTEPLIAYYRKKGLLVDLEAGGKPEEIMKTLAVKLKG
jgi:adenylate kinase